MKGLVPLVALVAVAWGAGAARAVTVPGLRSPSGNIRCAYAARTDPRNGGQLFCTIGHAAYAATLQDRCLNPNGATGQGVDWQGFVLPRTGKGEISCSSGALWFGTPRYVTVPYGRTWHAGPYACRSAVTGVTCTSPTHHGVFISRESWRAW